MCLALFLYADGMGLDRMMFLAFGVVAAVALPIALLATNTRVAFGSLPIYTYAIDHFDAPTKTGVPRNELVDAMRGLIVYFASEEDLISVSIRTNDGIAEPLFNDREALHFRDVKTLLGRVYAAQIAALLAVVAAVIAAAWAVGTGRTGLGMTVVRSVRNGAYATIAGVVLVGALSATGAFNSLFVLFHRISFDNDLWMGVETDRMVQLFPEAFFFQGAMLIGLGAAFEASLIVLTTTMAIRQMNLRGRKVAGDLNQTPLASAHPD